MKKIILISALALSLPISAKAQQTVSQTTINQAVKDAKQYFCASGSSGFAKHIQNCYQKDGASDKCILEDMSLYSFDSEFHKVIKNQTGQEPPTDDFLTETAINARADKYFLPKFGNMDKLYTYLRPGVTPLMDIMGKCLVENMQNQQNTQSTTQQPKQQNNTTTITKEGDGQTQTPPVQLKCPCMVQWKTIKDSDFSVFDFELKPVTGGFPISIATMPKTNSGEYYIPANQSGQYMMSIQSTGHWAIQIQQNYQQ
ncbi:hypothetical protein [Commensalibacter intestini]|nr:hypothetical protein [Commensalibacter intestini]